MSNTIYTIMLRAIKIVLVLLFFVFVRSNAQTGIAGIGTNTGTSSLQLWLEANAGVSLSGSNLTSWSDLSGYNNTATALTSSNRPTVINNTLNGYPVLRFDGADDYLQVGTTTSLNMTQWSIFIVVKVNNNKNFNYYFGKGVDTQENYQFLAFNSPKIRTPIYFTDGTRDWSTTGVIASINSYAIWQYDYSSAGGREIFLNGVSQVTDGTSKTPQTNSYEAWIGAERGTTDYFDGDFAEMAVFNTRQNDVQQIIVQNYLSAKYSIALGANDLYVGDNAGNGNYDFGVAGIGQSSTGNTQNSFSPSVAKGMGITYVSGFNNGDYIITGNNLKSGNGEQFTDVGGITGTSVSRWKRIWYIDVTNTGANMVTNIAFDMSSGGVNMVPTTASNYVLLYRTGQSGNWTELATANSISGDVINFNNITVSNDGYYTIGSRNYLQSPLPVTFKNLGIEKKGNQVIAFWDSFQTISGYKISLQRSKDAVNWENLTEKSFASTQNNGKDSLFSDIYDCTYLYYQLKCTEGNGDVSYSNILILPKDESCIFSLNLYPNPCTEYIILEGGSLEDSQIKMYSLNGNQIEPQVNKSAVNFIEISTENLEKGMYMIELKNKNIKKPINRQFIVQ